jgi:hypothetical protein
MIHVIFVHHLQTIHLIGLSWVKLSTKPIIITGQANIILVQLSNVQICLTTLQVPVTR